jgi:probable HAF family extracellular repeat protein
LTDLGTLGGAFGQAVGINSAAQVVGESETASNEIRATLWTSN